jgi:ATP-dependent Lhr-like helicase
MSLQDFHPLVRQWFDTTFTAPTEAQRLGWQSIQSHQDTLIAAPTGSGKTLTAFLWSIDRLLRLALVGDLEDQTYVVYVSPLRALSNDIQRNLQTPLAEILQLAREKQPECPEIRALVRTGDTPAKARQHMIRRPPHILVTTPESLYLLLTGSRSREMLRRVETVIVDEIHAVARDKRGSHLSLSLERLSALVHQEHAALVPKLELGNQSVRSSASSEREAEFRSSARPTGSSGTRSSGGVPNVGPVRIGLSATQKPLEELARFLVGATARRPAIVDIGHYRDMDLAVEVPEMELQAVCTHEHWAEVYARLVQLIDAHRTTLMFVNTRKLAERVAHQLRERLGEEHVLAHHGSLSHRSRQQTEQRLKDGGLKAVVATASLELGIDIGHIDLVCQLGSPRSIATFLQRVGRAGHHLGAVPKGRLFALSREELIECLAIVRGVREGRLDCVQIPQSPLDVLAQQIVAAVACEDWDENALFELVRHAYPYRALSRENYEAVLEMLSEGIAPERGRYGAYLHRDRVNRRLHARKGARLTAITCGGAIPEIADYRVVTDDENRTIVGTLDEDFAVESNGGDIFLLGNTSWRVKHVRGGEVVVADAHGAPPTVPFWNGEAPGRTFELSTEVGQLRKELSADIQQGPAGNESAIEWLVQSCGAGRHAAAQAVAYVAAHYAATGMVPTQKRLLFERFFDESGGMQLVVHAPFGARINRGWGLAMRKRFCRSFDFELQAAAGDNGIVLSLGAQHSFPLDQMFKLVPSRLARDVLVQAFLAVPFFGTRWRWNVTRSLIMKRARNGQRVPPHIQRMRAEDLLSAVFPAQTACQENVVGDIQVPDHPLVQQTVNDCLFEAADLVGLLNVLGDIETGAIEIVGLDSREPSPFAHELLNAHPYAFLDDAPLEERRARAVTMRRSLSAEALRDLGRLDSNAIAQVKSDAWPVVRDADELHDVLLTQGVVPAAECLSWQPYFDQLRSAGRATELRPWSFWVATERWPLAQAIWPTALAHPEVCVPPGVQQEWSREEAIVHVIRGRLECIGPTTNRALAETLSLDSSDIEIALATLETHGTVLRGHFMTSPQAPSSDERNESEIEWCDRRLLARIHRLTLEGLRRQIAPVPPEQFIRFLVRYQHLHPTTKLQGQAGLSALIEQLEGFEAPAGHWEKYLLPARLESYSPGWLDGLTFFGQAGWGRLRSRSSGTNNGKPMKAFTRSTPITLMARDHVPWLLHPAEDSAEPAIVDAPTALSPVWQSPRYSSSNSPGALRPTARQSPTPSLGSNAGAAYEAFLHYGALFPNQLGSLLQLVPAQIDEILGELAAAGLVTSDGYAALRALLGVKSREARRDARRAAISRSIHARPAPDRSAGRWTLLRSALLPAVSEAERTEHWCRLLLKRYGVMFRDLLANESAAPPWYALVRAYRRMEARGEIRGGRFVAGVAGEQYAFAEAVPMLRSAAAEPDDKPRILPATDPLNLSGWILSGARVPALPGNWIVIENGEIRESDGRMESSAKKKDQIGGPRVVGY